MAKKKKEEVGQIFFDSENLESLEQFLWICMQNVPVIVSCLKGLNCSIDKGYLPRNKELEAILILTDLQKGLKALGTLCQELQKDSKVSFEELRNSLIKHAREQAKRIEHNLNESSLKSQQV